MYTVELVFNVNGESDYCRFFAKSERSAKVLANALVDMSADDALSMYYGDEYEPEVPAGKHVYLYDEDGLELFF